MLIHGPFEPPLFTLQSVPITSFIGREEEVRTITSLVTDDGVRLLTLTGPGGVGKTRLAIKVTDQLAPSFGDGALFIPLSTIRDATLALSAIAYALGVRDASDRSLLERIRSALADKHLFLVLDNFEQIAAAAAEIGDLVLACPRMTVLVTSRVPLRIFGEVEYAVQPLELPDTDVASLPELAENPSVSLFVQRAQAVRSGFALQEANAWSVAEVCRRLDGLPLAIELAAARSKVLSPPALLARLTNSLDILTGGPQNQPVRLRTMRAAITWSVDLLTAEERTRFGQLAVFTGGFTLEAAEAVSGPVQDDQSALESGPTVLDTLASLVDSSLLRAQEEGDGELRFSMLETVREFGLEQLQSSQEAAAVRDRHAAYHLALAEQAAPELFGGPNQTAWLDRLDREHDNLRAALAWTEQSGDITTMQRLVGAIFWFWYVRGHVAEGRSWARLALADDRAEPGVNRARVLLAAGMLAHFQDDDADAERQLNASLDLYRAAGDRAGMLFAQAELGVLAEDSGDYDRAVTLLEQALHLYHAEHVPPPSLNLMVTMQAHIGVARWGQGAHDQAVPIWEEALERHIALDDRWGAANIKGYLAFAACEQGDLGRAARLQHESLSTFLEAGSVVDIVDGITKTATIAGLHHDYRLAARLFAAAEALDQAIGNKPAYPERLTFDRVRDEVRQALPPPELTAAHSEGRALSLSQAAVEALEVLDALINLETVRQPPNTPSAHELTTREIEVLELLVLGKTDREIADALFISPRTAQGHVGRIFDKLEVNSRSAAVAAALSSGLVAPSDPRERAST